MEQWAYHPWFGIILSVGIWIVARRLRQRAGTPLLDPVMLTVAAIIGVLLLADIPFEAYNRGGRVLDFLLGPSVVALAVPFYRQLEKVKRNLLPIFLSVAVGSMVDVAQGRMTMQGFAAALEAGERRAMGQTAPPRGLALVDVEY